MTPFSGDTAILEQVFKDRQVWETNKGKLISFRIFDRKENDPAGKAEWDGAFSLEVKSSGLEASDPECTSVFEIRHQWNFMDLKGVKVKKLTSTCK